MVHVKVLTAMGCAHCRQALDILQKLKTEFPQLQLEAVNIAERPEVVQKYQLTTTPGIVFNDTLEFTGGATEKQLREKLSVYTEREKK